MGLTGSNGMCSRRRGCDDACSEFIKRSKNPIRIWDAQFKDLSDIGSVYVGDLQNITADFRAVNAQFATRNFVKRAHNTDQQIFAWTVNDAAIMSPFLNGNVDGILTDQPELAR